MCYRLVLYCNVPDNSICMTHTDSIPGGVLVCKVIECEVDPLSWTSLDHPGTVCWASITLLSHHRCQVAMRGSDADKGWRLANLLWRIYNYKYIQELYFCCSEQNFFSCRLCHISIFNGKPTNCWSNLVNTCSRPSSKTWGHLDRVWFHPVLG